MKAMGVGVVGCGQIAGAYLRFARQFPSLKVVACQDLAGAKAKERAAEFNVPRAYERMDDLLRDDAVEIVLNLTVPAAHYEVSKAALQAGKHVWTEKPLAATREQGKELYDLAKARGLRLGGAPDTFFGAGHQTARRLIDQGAIGRPVHATATFTCPGHESWHGNPEFFYKPGGGPMLDMGPYYVTALMHMLGPIKRIMGLTTVAINPRTITHKSKDGTPGPFFGKKVEVQTPDHITGLMEFEAGALATITTSFAIEHRVYDRAHPITVFGTEGALQVPDPNGFDGTVLIARKGSTDWTEAPFEHLTGYGRAVGPAEMSAAIQANRPHRGSAEQVYCALDAMLGFIDSSRAGQAHRMTMAYTRPEALPTGLTMGEF